MYLMVSSYSLRPPSLFIRSFVSMSIFIPTHCCLIYLSVPDSNTGAFRDKPAAMPVENCARASMR